jgi:hypothetical protein
MYILIVNGQKISRCSNQTGLIHQGAQMRKMDKSLHVKVIKDV